jgi:AcrR family transcriptional regulator
MSVSRPQRLPPGRHGLPREFVVRSQRTRVLDAMAQAVAEQGFAATSVAEIVVRAGVSRRTFYELYNDKEDCFLAAYRAAVNGLVERVGEAQSGCEGSVERLRVAVKELLHFLEAEPAFAHMCIVEVLAAGPRALELRDETMRRLAPIVDVLNEEPGALPDIPAVTGEALVGAIYELLYARMMRRELDDLGSLLPQVMYLCVSVYLGPERAREELAG